MLLQIFLQGSDIILSAIFLRLILLQECQFSIKTFVCHLGVFDHNIIYRQLGVETHCCNIFVAHCAQRQVVS
jgi:hypothetical protein